MKYTNEEIERMKEICLQIEEWIKNEIMPELREDIRIGFGGKFRSPYTFNTTDEYHIGIYPDEKYIGFGEKFGSNNEPFCTEEEIEEILKDGKYHWWNRDSTAKGYSIYKKPNTMNTIIGYWPEIKTLLRKEKDKQMAKIRLLERFNI